MTDAAESTAVWAERLTKRYDGHVAIDSLSLSVPTGSIYGILGPNGAGKSTTLRILNDIIGPDEGEVRLLGRLAPGREAAARIGYLPEERGLYNKMFVGEILQFFGELRGLRGTEARRRADKWLERLEIGDWRGRKVQDLSKGMQQKVQFITAVLHEPELLILDEPWSGLDPINADVLREIVLEQRRAGHTILFSTHLMEQAEKLCEHVCIIARGRKVLEGELDEVKREAAGDRRVAVAFANDESARLADAILEETALVATRRKREDGWEVELAPEIDSDELLHRLLAAQAKLRRFEVVRPSLHQIFVDRVGAEVAEGRDG